jgi:hypothetical protein
MAIIMHNESHRIGSQYIAPQEVKQDHPHADYLARFEPMRRAKVQAAMDRFTRLNGKVMRRWDAADLLVTRRVRLDAAKSRLYVGDSGSFYDVSALTATAVAYIMWKAGA